MNGWDFLNEFQKLNLSKEIIVIILSSSTNPKDKLEAKKIKCVHGFEEKVLTDQKLQNILQSYYDNVN